MVQVRRAATAAVASGAPKTDEPATRREAPARVQEPVLVEGPPGCGKTELARAVTAARSARWSVWVGATTVSGVVGCTSKGTN